MSKNITDSNIYGSKLTILPPLNLLLNHFWSTQSVVTLKFYRSDMECVLEGARTGKDKVKCFGFVNNIFSLFNSLCCPYFFYRPVKHSASCFDQITVFTLLALCFLCGFMFNLLALCGFCLLVSGVGLQFIFDIFFCINVSLLCIFQI